MKLINFFAFASLFTLVACGDSDPADPGKEQGGKEEPVEPVTQVLPSTNPALPTNPASLNILFIGNSFTQDATEHLPGMITAAGINNVYMTRLYHGGYTLPEYNENWDVPNVCAMRSYRPGDTGWSDTEKLDDYPSKAMASRDWDVVVIQEHTGRSEGWVWPGTIKDALNGLLVKINAAQPNHKPTVIYLMAQTYSNGSNVLKTSFADSRFQMFSTTSYVVKKILDNTYIDKVISTGAVLENLRTTSLNVDNGMQLTRDSYHMDFGISRYAAACAVFETIITPTIGYDVNDCPYTYSVSSTASGSYSTPVTASNAPIARRAAHEAVVTPFAVTDLSSL